MNPEIAEAVEPTDPFPPTEPAEQAGETPTGTLRARAYGRAMKALREEHYPRFLELWEIECRTLGLDWVPPTTKAEREAARKKEADKAAADKIAAILRDHPGAAALLPSKEQSQ